jgi:hypothetical protein
VKCSLISLFVLALAASPSYAQGVGKATGEAGKYLLKKLGREAAEEGTERLSRRIASAAARYGDDAIAAVRKVGPKALSLADEAGDNAPRVLRLLTRHGDDAARILGHPQGMALFRRFGDDAVEVLVKHQGTAETLLETLGQPAIQALGAVSPQGGRRMAMMAGELSASGRTAEVMGVIARHGDRAMDFIWRNKGILAGGAALTAFLVNPEPYLDNANIAVKTVAENAVQPAVVAVGNVAQEAAGLLRWSLTILVVGLVACGLLAVRLKLGRGR